MGIITAVSNQKGGVGKTTLTVNLGKCLAARGRKVLMIDNDPQGNLTTALIGRDELPSEILDYGASNAEVPGVANTYTLFLENGNIQPLPVPKYDNIHLIGATRHLAEIATKDFQVLYDFKEHVQRLEDAYDDILIDCLPSFGLLQTTAHATAHYLLVPTHLDSFSMDGIHDQMKTAMATKRRINPRLGLLGIVANEVAGSRVNIDEYFGDVLVEKYSDFLFKTKITKSVKVKEAHALQQGIIEYSRESDQARQFQALTDEYLERIERQLGGH